MPSIKQLVFDLFLWSLLYFGLYLHIPYVDMASQVVISVMVAILLFAAVSLRAAKYYILEVADDKTFDIIEILEKGKAIKLLSYSVISTILEITFIYFTGSYILGTLYLISALLAVIAYNSIQKVVKGYYGNIIP